MRYFLLIVLVVYGYELFSQGCSQCKLTPEGDLQTGGSVAKSLNNAIIYLMITPYILLAFIFRKQLRSLYLMFKAKRNSSNL